MSGDRTAAVGADDTIVRAAVRRCRVARIATLSRNGRPSVTPLYVAWVRGEVWLTTADWTLAARNLRDDARASVLLQPEARGRRAGPVVRVTGRGEVRRDARSLRALNLRLARRYVLTPGGLRDVLTHLPLLRLRRAYRAQSRAKGGAVVLAVTPSRVEVLSRA
jgi:hypothetical protein